MILGVEPRRLRFERPDENAHATSTIGVSALQLRNRRFLTVSATNAVGDAVLAFKLQTNASKRFNVLPAQGYIRAGESAQITIQLKKSTSWSASDKFLVRGVVVIDDNAPVSSIWEKQPEGVEKIVVHCEYLEKEAAPYPPVPRDAPHLNATSTSHDPNGGERTPASGRSISPASRVSGGDGSSSSLSPAFDQLSSRLREILIKNHSSRTEDRLERPELEELMQLRGRLGAEQWRVLQEQAKQAVLERANDSWGPDRSASKPSGPNAENKNGEVNFDRGSKTNTKAEPVELADMLVEGVSLLREKRVAESTTVFVKALDHASSKSVAQAQVLVGLGSALEAAGMVDRALDCYIDALKIYEQSGDSDCRESVSSAIAHVYADMRDHTMAAAWFDFQLETIDADPDNGQRRSDVTDARDRQMRLGHVSEALLSAARGRVASHLASGQSRTALVRSSAALVVQQQKKVAQRPDSSGCAPQQSAQGAVQAAQRRESVSSATIGRRAGIETLWEPRSENGSSTYTSSSMDTNNAHRVIDPPKSMGLPSRKSFGSISSANASGRPATFSSLSSAPHYLVPTTASRASIVSKNRDPLSSGRSISSSSSDSGRKNPIDIEAVRVRNSAAAALHVRRSLEARRKRDQNMGIRAPRAASAKSASLRQQDSAKNSSAHETWSPRGKTKANGEASLVVMLHVLSSVDGQVFSVALPGPLSATMSMTVREMRERVSFVTGIELHDFELVVANTRLSDSWVGHDIGLGAYTEVELHLLPGVAPSKYVSSPKATRLEQQGKEIPRSSIALHDEDSDITLPVPLVAVPKQKPPMLSANSLSPSSNDGKTFSSISVINGDVLAVDESSAELEALCASVQSKLDNQRRVALQADEIGAKARAIIKENGGYESSSDESDSGGGDQKGEKPSDLAKYSSSLMERVVSLEAKLAASDARVTESQAQLVIAKARILDLTRKITTERRARNEIEETFALLKADFDALSIEAKASFSNFNSVLQQQVRSIQAAASLVPNLVLVAHDDDDIVAFERGGGINKTWQLEPNGALFKARAMIALSGRLESAFGEKNASLASLTQEVCDNILEGISETTFIVNFGQPLFFNAAQNKSYMLALVENLFKDMALDLQSTKMRALVTSLVKPDVPIDVLNPDHSARSNVSIHVDKATKNIKVQNAVTVKFHNINDFARLFEMVSAQVKSTMPAHVFTVLENEHTQRRLMFVQAYGGLEPQGAASSSTVLTDFLRAAGACCPNTQTLVFAPARQQAAPAASVLLEAFFAPLKRAKN